MANKTIEDLTAKTTAASGDLFLFRRPTDTASDKDHGFDWDDLLAQLTSIIMPTASILPFVDSSAPTGFLLCNGQAVSRTTYSTLFGIIGTTYGVGDGSTTFNVPDYRGMFLRGTGSHGSLTMADSNPFAGPSLGSSENDQFQGHYHDFNWDGRTNAGAFVNDNTTRVWFVNTSTADTDHSTSPQGTTPATDGVNGSPRSGDETRPVAYGVNYIIKY